MKRMTYFVMALAMILGLSQCKKDQIEPQGERVHITLNVDGGNNNSRVVVDPTNGGANNYASVDFENGDTIYVGYNNAYVGTLTYSDGIFSGDITITQSGDQPLYFYCLGGKGFSVSRDGNTATVVISDQSSKYPVISYAPSKQNYPSADNSYTAKLMNKVSIMKFNVAETTPSTAAICITGMNNMVTVEFDKWGDTGDGLGNDTDQGFSYSVNTDDEGLIKMPGKDENNVTWAIVLPQAALGAGASGTAYTEDATESNCYLGSRPQLPTIGSNEYIIVNEDEPITITMTTPKYVDLSTQSEDFTAINGQVLTGTLTNNVMISIAAGATVLLDNAIINIDSYDTQYPGLTCLGDATIILVGENTVYGYKKPSIQAPPVGYTLTIDGTGSLAAGFIGTSGCACIGSPEGGSCGDIIINGGTINITDTYGGAGIGSGTNSASCGDITINGGSLTVTAYNYGAGIGSGYNGSSCGIITINGGEIQGYGNGSTSYSGAGIGSGRSSSCSDIIINNGVTRVRAYKQCRIGGHCIGAGYGGTMNGNLIIDNTNYGNTTVPGKGVVGESGVLEVTTSNYNTWLLVHK